MVFNKESDFEDALIKMLSESCGWSPEVLTYQTEADLLRNWADILFENNRQIDRLNDYPLTDGEMQQILEQIAALRTPLQLNGFINGRSVTIKRDHPDDTAHLGKEVSLKIYDRDEIAAGQSRYQIARQPIFKGSSNILPKRRGDFMLLINGMPVIHIELKKSGIPLSQACNQIEKYMHEGIFSGLFSLVQIFVAMTPEEAVYFANPGQDGKFNRDFFFHWGNFNNDPVNDWQSVARDLLSIPMAHQLIGFYTVADQNDGVLKVMRSYQIAAANQISAKVAKHRWEKGQQRGGYIWHTTGSGKTMTSFKSAQLIANSKDADKVVFLIDRIELGTQSAREYRGFAEDSDTIQETEDTEVLMSKLKSHAAADTLIVTSIQKISNIRSDEHRRVTEAELHQLQRKRIVFIVDECHRSSFGDMMHTVKQTFPTALFFGFSGTPIQIENQKKGSTTADVFGNELHRYSIADGIRDKNVLGFDINKVLTFPEKDMRVKVGLEKAGAPSIEAAQASLETAKILNDYLYHIPMAGESDPLGHTVRGIEDELLSRGQYATDEHRRMVVQDISEHWVLLSQGYKFHGMLATSSIPEAIDYYRLFKKICPQLHVSCIFDHHIGNEDGAYKAYRGEPVAFFKEGGLKEIIEDYNAQFGHTFDMGSFPRMKKDIQSRLAHRRPYQDIVTKREEQLDLLIVVDQMLTGYDSKWINVLYLDKLLAYENIIQAFSRTNRLFDKSQKPFGSIKYYRAPYTMEKRIHAAVKLYSGDKPLGLFADKLDQHIESMNFCYQTIKGIFQNAGIDDYHKLPKETEAIKAFAKAFNEWNRLLSAAKIQGFTWQQKEYPKPDSDAKIRMEADESTYFKLVQRYKEIPSAYSSDEKDLPFDLVGYITTMDTDHIDADYMNLNFEKYKKALDSGNPEEVARTEEELHKNFAALSQEDQKYAKIFLVDLKSGNVILEENKTVRDYINAYRADAKNDQIHRFAETLGLDEEGLRHMIGLGLTDETINEFARLDKLLASANIDKAKVYFEQKDPAKTFTRPRVIMKLNTEVKNFILNQDSYTDK